MTLEEKEKLLQHIILTMITSKPIPSLPPLRSAQIIPVDFSKPKPRRLRFGPCQVIEFYRPLLQPYRP